MKITYYGHSSFKVEASDGTRVILDPYVAGSFDGAISYAPINEPADAVIASHEHDDHAGVGAIPGNPLILVHPKSQMVGGIQVTGIDVAHDEVGGTKRGRNTIVVLDDGDIRLAHLGDLGHLLDRATIDALGRLDVILIPVGGFFTIDEKEAAQVADSLSPRIVVPMHYKTEKCDFPIAPVSAFVKTQTNVVQLASSVMEVTSESLPQDRQTVVMQHAR